MKAWIFGLTIYFYDYQVMAQKYGIVHALSRRKNPKGPSITSIDPSKFLVQIAKSKYKINRKTEIRITDLSLNSKPT